MADFDLTPTTYPVSDYCAAINRQEVVVNRNYQRSDKVWPPAAQSFLVETILLGYPIPKLSLHYITDIKTRQSRKEIIDGQQRTKAIKSFYDDQLRLSRTLDLDEAAGKTYSELSEDLKKAFLDYSISADIFTGASPDKIREVFRRINSYTVPLNPEEHRHATYQGEMKWFIYQLCRQFDAYVSNVGTFSQGRLVRMSDAKLYSELVHALINGIRTTNRHHLDRMYAEFDKEFPRQNELESRFLESMDFIATFTDLHDGPLMRPHMIYSLILAIMHFIKPVVTLTSMVPRGVVEARSDEGSKISILSELASVIDLDRDDVPSHMLAFYDASKTKTNVRQQREIRVAWLYSALNGHLGVLP